MKLQWLGTAGFQIDTGKHVFLIDPYLSRNPKSHPMQPLKTCDICKAEQIFVSHGHFDHSYDIPGLAKQNQCSIYCSDTVSHTLKKRGVDRRQIHAVKVNGYRVDFDGYSAEAFFSRHIGPDIPLVARTLCNIGMSWPRLLRMHMGCPQGQVLSWKFTIGSYTIHHFGSGGSTRHELERLSTYQPDLLLIPLQGHTRICDIALEYVRVFKPRMVIAHHHDNFYPPISADIDITPFVKAVREKCRGTEVLVLEINQWISL
ncbi:MAG: MBL fold metallo-hydrolase [Dehalococcoidia bacterium]|nr:MBL fold metallo-hydrolase [Dehalococcoidia bacterium]